MTSGCGDGGRRRALRAVWLALATSWAATPVAAQTAPPIGPVPDAKVAPPAAPSATPPVGGAAPAEPPAGGTVTLPPPPDAANPTPEHIAMARRLILATGISRSFAVMIAEFMDQIGNSVTQGRPDLVKDMHVVLDQLKPEFDEQSAEMIDQSARIYATLLSEKDIATILAFYNSEAGKRYVALQPLFLEQLLPGTQAWQQKIATNMMARVRAEMKKKGHDL